MTRCIVCGFDETAGRRHAASVAARLAHDLDSRALLVYVLEGGGLRRPVPTVPMGRARRMRKAVRTGAEEHAFPDGTAVRVKTGAPARTLIALSDREDAEMIVVGAGGRSTISTALLWGVGSRGRGNLGSLLHGSVPAEVAGDGRTAVVVLPLDTRLEPGSGHYELAAGAA